MGPDAELCLEQTLKDETLSLYLPVRIEEPKNNRDRMQALRIELVHALSRRGSRVPLQELGQEPRVQQRKQGLHQAKKLIDFIRVFPANFNIVADDTQMMVELASTDVSDMGMIDGLINRHLQADNRGHNSFNNNNNRSHSSNDRSRRDDRGYDRDRR